ncbi:MAG: hypothetical protein V4722_23630 [Bacteroidota bacterium]
MTTKLEKSYKHLQTEKRISYMPAIFYRISQLLGYNGLYYEAANYFPGGNRGFPLKNGYIVYCYKTREQAKQIRDSAYNAYLRQR